MLVNVDRGFISILLVDYPIQLLIMKSIGVPTLLYGTECICLSKSDIHVLESTQSTIVKHIFGLCKRSHHTNLLMALKIPKIEDVIMRNAIMFLRRIFMLDSPVRRLQINLLSDFMYTGVSIENTLIHRIVTAGYSPVTIALCKQFRCDLRYTTCGNGIVDSLRYLYCRPGMIGMMRFPPRRFLTN